MSSKGLPDTSHRAGTCPRCGLQSSFEVAGAIAISFNPDLFVLDQVGEGQSPLPTEQVAVLICRHCNQGMAVFENQNGAFHWWPTATTSLPEDVPEEIGSAFIESVTAFNACCFRSSAAMARRTLEAVCAQQGETSGSLYKRIENLANCGKLLPTYRDWAHEVREVGNDGVHDLIENVSQEDAEALIGFLRELLKFFYQMPAELARRRNRP